MRQCEGLGTFAKNQNQGERGVAVVRGFGLFALPR
jgi:hypothetical protein